MASAREPKLQDVPSMRIQSDCILPHTCVGKQKAMDGRSVPSWLSVDAPRLQFDNQRYKWYELRPTPRSKRLVCVRQSFHHRFAAILRPSTLALIGFASFALAPH